MGHVTNRCICGKQDMPKTQTLEKCKICVDPKCTIKEKEIHSQYGLLLHHGCEKKEIVEKQKT